MCSEASSTPQSSGLCSSFHAGSLSRGGIFFRRFTNSTLFSSEWSTMRPSASWKVTSNPSSSANRFLCRLGSLSEKFAGVEDFQQDGFSFLGEVNNNRIHLFSVIYGFLIDFILQDILFIAAPDLQYRPLLAGYMVMTLIWLSSWTCQIST